jgi:Fic-DOC domain mobile mystery protein B
LEEDLEETLTPQDATPLDPDEAAALLPTHIQTREELNEWEGANILAAEEWAFARTRGDVLSIYFLKRLHSKMFDETWEWAGQFRRSEKNVGIPWEHIPEALKNLFDDARYWLENDTFSLEEIAARVHHRLTEIHPFPNGNGRVARLLTDVFLVSRSRPRFQWGQGDLSQEGDVRTRYIAALKAADGGEMGPLLEFLA